MNAGRATRVVLWLVVLLAAGLLAGCGRGSQVLRADDSGSEATLEPGETVTLRLESNPTTGYAWEVRGLEGQNVVTLVDQSYEADSKLLGSGGVDTITFKAANAGEVTVELVYRRSWETDVAPIKSVSYTLVVR